MDFGTPRLPSSHLHSSRRQPSPSLHLDGTKSDAAVLLESTRLVPRPHQSPSDHRRSQAPMDVAPKLPRGRDDGDWPPRRRTLVLVVMDRPTQARLITLTLSHGGCDTRTVASAADVAAPLATWKPHVAVVDMDVDSTEVLALMGVRPPGAARLPVIALTRRGDLKGMLAALSHGVDDILVMPLSPPELLGRVAALLRRSHVDNVTFTPVMKLGDLEIDILNRTVRTSGSGVHLTSLEQSLLYLLVANAGHVLTREEILDSLWGTDYVADSTVVDREIRNLRTRLQDDWRRPSYIATVPGKGYRFLPTRGALN